jgi:hypothetical protein
LTGKNVQGFGELTDNLGQEYLFTPSGHQVKDDLALEYYIPYNYRIDYQKPKKLTLTATTQPDHHEQIYDIIGKIEIDEWEENKPGPDLFGNGRQIDCLKKIIYESENNHDWNRFDKLLDLIPGEPEDGPEAGKNAFFREQQRLNKLMWMNEADKAFPLAKRLFGIIKDDLVSVKTDPNNTSFDTLHLIETYIKLGLLQN